MADTTGIQLSVDITSLLSQVDNAITQVNERIKKANLEKLKLGVDTTAIDSAISKLKTDLAGISGKINIPKVELGLPSTSGKSAVTDTVQAQTKQMDAIVSAYMKDFNIMKKSASMTAEEIRVIFTEALSKAFNFINSGDKAGVENAFKELIALTKEFEKPVKNQDAIARLEDLKSGLQGVIPVSRQVKEELDFIYGSANESAKMLSKAFGATGWRMKTHGDMGTDSYMMSVPGYQDILNTTDAVHQLMEALISAKAEAKTLITSFDLGRNDSDIVNWIGRIVEWTNANQNQSESAKSVVQGENQVVSSMQSATEVAQKLQTAMASVWENRAGKYTSDTMSDIGEYQNAVNALGQALDRISSVKNLDKNGTLTALNETLGRFSVGGVTVQELVNELNSFAAAEQKTTEAINSEKAAVNSLNPELEKLIANKRKALSAATNSNSGKTNNNTHIGVDTGSFIKSINVAIRTINKNTDGLAKVKISADETRLRSSIRQAVSSINKSGELGSTPVKLSVTFKNAKQAVKDFQAQVSGQTVKLLSVNEQITEALKQQAQAEKDVANAAKDGSAEAVNANNSEKQSNKELANALDELIKKREHLNNLIRESVNLDANRNPVSKTEVTGTRSSNTVTRSAYDSETQRFNVTGYTENYNASAMKSNLDKLYVSAVQLETKLQDVYVAYTDINTAKPIKNDENLKELKTRFDDIINSIIKMTQTSGENSAVMRANIDAQIADLERQAEAYRNAEYAATSLRTKDISTIKLEQKGELDSFVAKINSSKVHISEFTNDIKNLYSSLENVKDASSLTNFLNQFSAITSKFKGMSAEANAVSKTITEIQRVMTSLDSIANKPVLYKNKGNDSVRELLVDVEKTRKSYQELLNTLGKNPSTEALAKAREQMAGLKAETEKTKERANELVALFGNVRVDNNIERRLEQLYSKVEALKITNSAGLGKPNPNTGNTFGQDLDAILAKIPQARAEGELLTKSLEDGFKSVSLQMKAAGAVGKTFFQEMGEKAAKFIKWTAMTLVITRARMYFRKLFTTVYELDESLIDLRKTFKGSESDLEDFYFEANKIAKQMGVTTNEIIKQGAAFSRLGFSSNEAMKKMAEMSAMFAAISPDMNTEQAQNGLVSIMKAFNIDPNNVLDEILSKVNIIGNTAATSNGEIVEMLTRSSAAMAAANNTLEQTIALGTAGVEILRDADKMGTSLKSVSMNIRALDEETGELIGDTEEVFSKIADFTKTVSNPTGVSIFTDKAHTAYRSTYDILKDISKVWKDISDTNQAELVKVLGGKYQGNAVSAIIQNFDAAEKAMDSMANSAGSAEAEMNIVRESVAYNLNELKETFTSFAQNTITRDFLKDLINSGTKLIEVFSDAAPVLKPLLSLIGGVTKAAGLVD